MVLRARNRINRVTISYKLMPKITAASVGAVREFEKAFHPRPTHHMHTDRQIHSTIVIQNNTT